MLLRLAYLGVTNVFALLRLLPVSSRDKDAEILALRHQLRAPWCCGWSVRIPGGGIAGYTASCWCSG